jgi:hypothetical protein
MNDAMQSMDGRGGGSDGHRRASRWETAKAVARLRWATATAATAQWKVSRWRDHDARHRDHSGRRRRNGWQDDRASVAGQGDGVRGKGKSLAGNVDKCVCRLHPSNDIHFCLSPTCRKCRPDTSATFCYVGNFFGCRGYVGETCCQHTLLRVHRNQY